MGSLLGFAFDAKYYDEIAKNDDLVVNVECTLNELYNGASKTVSYTKRVIINKYIFQTLAGDGKTVIE